jgi:hypothetical protein
MKMLGKIDVVIRGVGDIIMSRDTGDRTRIKDQGSKENKKKEFEEAQYRDSKGRLILWAEHLEKCFEMAGNQVAFKGKAKYGKIICGGIFVEPQEIPFKVGTFKGKKWGVPVPFEKFVRIPPKTGARVLKTRAKIDNWEVSFTLNVVNDEINFDALKEIVTKAGIHNGLLSWRPKHGRFEVIRFEKQK